ncbi:MAG: FHA domain-containing protein [Burkholderiales bacterium]|nr:FHA domain-containing protein [Phycisphaerae bacterium]
MNVVLVMFRENGERRSFTLTRDITVVGRREDADFRIPLTDISRKHCRFIKDAGDLLLEDLGSSNGTFRNGQRITQETELAPGDFVQIGPVQFMVQIDGSPSDDELEQQASRGGSSETRHGQVGIADPELAGFTSPGLSGSGMLPPPPVPPSLLGHPADDDLELIDDADALEEIGDDDLIDLNEPDLKEPGSSEPDLNDSDLNDSDLDEAEEKQK